MLNRNPSGLVSNTVPLRHIQKEKPMKVLFPLMIAIVLAGCVEHETVVERRGPPPDAYAPGPYGPPGAPPPVIVETYGVAPYPGAVWVRGSWFWGNRHWRWHRGHWRHH